MTLTTTLYDAGCRVLVLGGKLDVRFLPGAVRLPLVVECIVPEIPIHRPVVDHLAPVLDGFPRLLRYVVNRDNEVGQLEGQLSTFLLRLNRQRSQLEKLDVALFDRLLFQHFTRDFLERDIHTRFGCNLSGGLV